LIPQSLGAAIGMNRSAVATRRLGAGLASLYGGAILVAATAPFLFVTASTSYLLISATMVVRGIGVGLAIMPAMTAAFSSLSHDQISDASPQLNVVQRVGGSLGTAVITVVLQRKLLHLGAHPTANATAAAFAHTYVWVVVLSLAALIPAAFLWRLERRNPVDSYEDLPYDESMIESLG
jgi:hypothetical protein